MNQLYLITGAAGHLGSTITEKLLKKGKQVKAFVLPGDVISISGALQVVPGDVRDTSSLEPFFQDVSGSNTVLIHCAGIVSIASKYKQNVYDVNVSGTKNIVEMCRKHGIHKLVYVSSVHAIAEKPNGIITEADHFNPEEVTGLYAKTKAAASEFVLEAAEKGLNASIVHPSGIIGPNDLGHGHLTALIIDYCKGALTSIVDGGYDFVDVRDVAEGILACVEKGGAGESYILSNRYFRIRDIIHILHLITGRKDIKRILPQWFVSSMAPLAELYYKIRGQPPLFTAYSLYTLRTGAVFSHEKATRELGYTTRSMEETLTDTVAWLRQHGIV